MKRRVETWTETHELWVVRRPVHAAESPSWCADCAGPTGTLTPEEVGAMAGVSTRTVYHWVETGLVHFQESEAGIVFVCLASLPPAAEGRGQMPPKPGIEN